MIRPIIKYALIYIALDLIFGPGLGVLMFLIYFFYIEEWMTYNTMNIYNLQDNLFVPVELISEQKIERETSSHETYTDKILTVKDEQGNIFQDWEIKFMDIPWLADIERGIPQTLLTNPTLGTGFADIRMYPNVSSSTDSKPPTDIT